MILRVVENVLEADFSSDDVNDDSVEQIISNTEETWQKDRTEEEKTKNTEQGKTAERIVERCINEEHAETIDCLSYDEIRNDGLKKHAPFDFLVWEKGTVNVEPIIVSIQNDISQSNNSFVRLSSYSRKLCRDNNVKIVEVKSTNIRQQYKDDSGFNGDYSDDSEVLKLANHIRTKDDVFCYPYYKRSEDSEDYTIDDYCEYVKSREFKLSGYVGEELRHKVIELEQEKQCSDIFIRVYLDEEQKQGIIIGWLDREHLLDYEVVLKKMKKPNKSEKAIYLAKNLAETISITRLDTLFAKTNTEPKGISTTVYANPYTKTSFYHKIRECKYLENVSENEIIIYGSETEAIAAGRFINRCKNCF